MKAGADDDILAPYTAGAVYRLVMLMVPFRLSRSVVMHCLWQQLALYVSAGDAHDDCVEPVLPVCISLPYSCHIDIETDLDMDMNIDMDTNTDTDTHTHIYICIYIYTYM